jgi:hypothetical protein
MERNMVDIILTPGFIEKICEDESGDDDKHTWTHVVIEAYCMIDAEYNRKHSKHDYLLKSDSDDFEFEPVENKEYDPDITKPETPEFCKKRYWPCYNCLSNDCPHLSFCEASENIKNAVRKAFREEIENEEKEESE